MDIKPVQQTPKNIAAYETALQIEQERYKDVSDVHDLPAIFHYWSHTYVLPMVLECGGTSTDHINAIYAKYLKLSAKNAVRETPTFLSVGAGNCDTEVRVAQLLKEAGLPRFVIECLDLNPAMLDRGRHLAAEADVVEHFAFTQGDFNTWVANGEYHAVIAHHALHHVLELEHLFDQIKRSLRPDGYFVAGDMIGRNGHLRWPEALRELQRFWRELPVDYRWNRPLERYEELYVNHDCSTEGFEGIRAQDVLPLLLSRFDFRAFIGFGNLVDVFTDRAFGHHFDIEAEWDRNFIDRLHAFDEQAILGGGLTPTHMIAVMTPAPCAEHHYSRGLAPSSCVHEPAMEQDLNTGLLAITTTSLQRWPHMDAVRQQRLAATGGTPPYHWYAIGLPEGIELSSAGLLGGMPVRDGLFPVTVTVTDSSPEPQTATQRYTVRLQNVRIVAPPHPWFVASSTLSHGLALEANGAGPVRSALRRLGGRDRTRYKTVVPHITIGGPWNTSIHILNPSSSPVSVAVDFWSDAGGPLVLPLDVTSGGKSEARETASLRESLLPFASLAVLTTVDKPEQQTGWAGIVTSRQLTGYSVFHHKLPDGLHSQEAVPLGLGGRQSFFLLYDNREQVRSGVAVVNLASSPALVDLVAWDKDWNQVARQALTMPARGHASFLLPDQLPATDDRQGIVQFRAAGGGRIAGLSLLFRPDGSFTTTPGLSTN